ncbi:MAG: hypothetical protein AAF791_08750 [Bacteroidota bacterium]
MHRHLLHCGLALLVGLAPTAALAQDAEGGPPEEEEGPGVRFNGLGRAFIQETDLGGTLLDTDTTSAETLADGEFVLDLEVNAQPNRVTEVQGTIRLRNEFGGFFGSGVTVEVRELWARGVVANVIEYRLGDMDYALTPFTVYLPEADGDINPAEVFSPLREVVEYEKFYTGRNTRRFQGGSVDFGLDFDQAIQTLDIRSFIARLQPTNFQDTPTRLIGGGRVGLTSVPLGPTGAQARLGVNLASTWDDLDSGNANSGLRNHVLTLDGTLAILDGDGLAFSIVGEGGQSIAKTAEQVEGGGEDGGEDMQNVLLRERDTFFQIGAEANLKQTGVNAGLHFVNVGPDFFSTAAQSKRIDYTRALSQFNRIGNDRALRGAGLFDLSRDRGLYTTNTESTQLVAYDPRYNNVLPYGTATPNRRGVRLDADYMPEASAVQGGLLVALLQEIRGQGTEELKDFALVRAEADVAIGSLASLGRDIGASLGLQFESTSRGGNQFETVDLTSFLIEVGLSAEVYDRLDVLLGAKTRSSSGNDYVPQLENFNDVRDFPGRFVTDDSESLLGAGLRYRFRDDVFLTVQYQHYSYGDDATPADDYSLGQVFALYTMSF